MSWRVRWTFVSLANNFVGTQSCPNPLGRSAGRPDPTRPWYVRVLDSTDLHRISLVRASGETLKRHFFDALEGTVNLCSLGEEFCWHPILPDPARPLRRGAPTRYARGMSGFWIRQVWTLVWLLCDLSGLATFALNHTGQPGAARGDGWSRSCRHASRRRVPRR